MFGLSSSNLTDGRDCLVLLKIIYHTRHILTSVLVHGNLSMNLGRFAPSQLNIEMSEKLHTYPPERLPMTGTQITCIGTPLVLAIVFGFRAWLRHRDAQEAATKKRINNAENLRRAEHYLETLRHDMCLNGPGRGTRFFRFHTDGANLAVYLYEQTSNGGSINGRVVEIELDMLNDFGNIIYGGLATFEGQVPLYKLAPALRRLCGDTPIYRYESGTSEA